MGLVDQAMEIAMTEKWTASSDGRGAYDIHCKSGFVVAECVQTLAMALHIAELHNKSL